MPSVIVSKDDGEDVKIRYKKLEDGTWLITRPDGVEEIVSPGASKRTVEQLIRKSHDDDY